MDCSVVQWIHDHKLTAEVNRLIWLLDRPVIIDNINALSDESSYGLRQKMYTLVLCLNRCNIWLDSNIYINILHQLHPAWPPIIAFTECDKLEVKPTKPGQNLWMKYIGHYLTHHHPQWTMFNIHVNIFERLRYLFRRNDWAYAGLDFDLSPQTYPLLSAVQERTLHNKMVLQTEKPLPPCEKTVLCPYQQTYYDVPKPSDSELQIYLLRRYGFTLSKDDIVSWQIPSTLERDRKSLEIYIRGLRPNDVNNHFYSDRVAWYHDMKLWLDDLSSLPDNHRQAVLYLAWCANQLHHHLNILEYNNEHYTIPQISSLVAPLTISQSHTISCSVEERREWLRRYYHLIWWNKEDGINLWREADCRTNRINRSCLGNNSLDSCVLDPCALLGAVYLQSKDRKNVLIEEIKHILADKPLNEIQQIHMRISRDKRTRVNSHMEKSYITHHYHMVESRIIRSLWLQVIDSYYQKGSNRNRPVLTTVPSKRWKPT